MSGRDEGLRAALVEAQHSINLERGSCDHDGGIGDCEEHVRDLLARAALNAVPVQPETGTCWFCKGTFVVDALIAGYDTFDEQRLACLACNERMSGNWRVGAAAPPAHPDGVPVQPETRLPGESPCRFVNGFDGWSTCVVHGWTGGQAERRRVLVCPDVNNGLRAAAPPAHCGIDVEALGRAIHETYCHRNAPMHSASDHSAGRLAAADDQESGQ